MSSAIDLYNLEKAVAKEATSSLRKAFQTAINRTTTRRTGEAAKSANSRAVFKSDRLQRVTLKAPHYIFKQHYGFEGTKSNGVNMRLRATDVLTIAVEKSGVLNTLADKIADIRGSQIITAINFSKNGK